MTNPTGNLRIVPIESAEEWKASLAGPHDCYHLPFYHLLASDSGEGIPKLFVYQNEGITLCLPLLIRRIEHLASKDSGEEVWYDATSVYGYPGPVCSHSVISDHVASDFRDCLRSLLLQMRIVSVFSRLHPLIDQAPLLSGLGSMVVHGRTVSIDLSVSEDAQLARYRKNHRRSLSKFVQAGGSCVVDEEFRYLDAFIGIYTENMRRLSAAEEYIFPRQYFHDLTNTKEAEVKLIVCTVGSQPACMGIFMKYGDILHYHLGGTVEAWINLSPLKFLIDAARHWGFTHGAKVFHLGGGVGAKDDSLFQFKLGFSSRLHAFKTWRWVLIPSVYDRLVALNNVNRPDADGTEESSDFFPQYRHRQGLKPLHRAVSCEPRKG